MTKIVVVCTGNTCRSPVVEGVLKQRLEAKGLTSWQVRSAGTDAREGEPATGHSIDAILEVEGIDISQHRASQLTAEDVQSADLILCMAESHRTKILDRFKADGSKIRLLAEMTDLGSVDVVDPHGQPRQNYDAMVQNVISLIDQGLEQIIATASAD